jgi:hypothetical protein
MHAALIADAPVCPQESRFADIHTRAGCLLEHTENKTTVRNLG